MELQFKPERLNIIKRLRGISITEIDKKMKEICGAKNSFNIDRKGNWRSCGFLLLYQCGH